MQAEFQITHSCISQQFRHVGALKKAALDGESLSACKRKWNSSLYTTLCTSRRYCSLMYCRWLCFANMTLTEHMVKTNPIKIINGLSFVLKL